MTGITRQRAAEVVAELFGTEAVYEGAYYGIWSARDREGKKWKFMSDGSIDTQRKSGGRIVSADGEYSTEMVSPNIIYDEMGELQEVGTLSAEHGGLSMSPVVSMFMQMRANHTPQSLKNAL